MVKNRAMHDIVDTAANALNLVTSHSVVLVGGWGQVGVPHALIAALSVKPVHSLILVSNNCGTGVPDDVNALFAAGQVGKVLASYPAHPRATAFRDRLAAGLVELELVPQGTLVERLRCAGVGLGGFYTTTGVDTSLAVGKEVRELQGRPHVFEHALRGDVALVHAWQGDRFGNLRYRGAGRAFNSVMAMAGSTVVAEVEELLEAPMAPENVHTPGLVVTRIVPLKGEL